MQGKKFNEIFFPNSLYMSLYHLKTISKLWIRVMNVDIMILRDPIEIGGGE